MIIGLRYGHSINCTGAAGIVKETEQMQKYYKAIKLLLENYNHTVIDCNSNANTESGELSEGVTKANNANVDIFISLHMNSFNGQARGTETLVSSTSSKAYPVAQRLVNNFAELGFVNRGVKFEKLYEMNHVSAPNIISEICFCDSQTDIDIYNKYSWDKLAHIFCNAIDNNIPKDVTKSQITKNEKGYVVTNYLPHSVNYDGVNIKDILNYFEGVTCYVRGNDKGVWFETQYLSIEKCNQLKNTLGSLFYSIEK